MSAGHTRVGIVEYDCPTDDLRSSLVMQSSIRSRCRRSRQSRRQLLPLLLLQIKFALMLLLAKSWTTSLGVDSRDENLDTSFFSDGRHLRPTHTPPPLLRDGLLGEQTQFPVGYAGKLGRVWSRHFRRSSPCDLQFGHTRGTRLLLAAGGLSLPFPAVLGIGMLHSTTRPVSLVCCGHARSLGCDRAFDTAQRKGSRSATPTSPMRTSNPQQLREAEVAWRPLIPTSKALLCLRDYFRYCRFHINSRNQVCGRRPGSCHCGVEKYPREN